MVQEGGLRAPERKAFKLKFKKSFGTQKDLDDELRRQFDVCHSCRRCFNLCDSFPKLFDLIDDSETMELDSVDSKHFDKVVDACTLCDMCFMVSCPYVPPHEFAIDIPSLFIRHKAQNQNKIGLIDNLLSKTDKNGKLGLIFNKIFNSITNKKNKLLRIILKAITGIEVNIRLPKYNSKIFLKIKSKALSLRVSKEYNDKIIIFSTCYVGYNDSDIGDALIKVLEKNNIYYEEGYTECCKMPQLSKER